MITQFRSNSQISKIFKKLDTPLTPFKLSSKRNFRLNNIKSHAITEVHCLLNKNQLTTEKLIPISKHRQKQQKHKSISNLLCISKQKVLKQQIKKRDRLQIYRKMLQPKIIKTRLFSPQYRRRACSADEKQRRLPLLMTFGQSY